MYLAVLSIAFLSAIIWLSLQKRSSGHITVYPGIDEYLLWISSLIWATLECIFHTSANNMNNFVTNIRRDMIPATMLKILGFVLIFLPFAAGLFYFVISPMLLLMIPLSSLVLCIANGLYPPPGFLVIVSMIVIISIGIRVGIWVLVASYRLYSWMLQMNNYVILCLGLLLAAAGLCDYETIRSRWSSD